MQIEEEVALVKSSLRPNKAAGELDTTAPTANSWIARKKRRRESHVSPEALLSWFKKQLSPYECLAINDLTFSFQVEF